MERESDEFQWALIQFKWIKLSLSAVSCVAQESIISFSCKYKVLCVSQVPQIPMILSVQNYLWWLHKAHNINCTLTRKRKKGFVSHALMWSVVWLGQEWTILTYWIFFTYPSGEKPIKNGWKKEASWADLLSVSDIQNGPIKFSFLPVEWVGKSFLLRVCSHVVLMMRKIQVDGRK